MLLDILRPLDIAVSGVGEVTNLERKEYPLSCHNIDSSLENGADVPSDPLLAEAEENCKTVNDTNCRSASVKVANYCSEKLVAAKEIGRNVKTGEDRDSEEPSLLVKGEVFSGEFEKASIAIDLTNLLGSGKIVICGNIL